MIPIVEDDRGTAKADVMYRGRVLRAVYEHLFSRRFRYQKRVCSKAFWERAIFLQIAFHNAAPCRMHPHIAWDGGSGDDSLPQSAE